MLFTISYARPKAMDITWWIRASRLTEAAVWEEIHVSHWK